ncbi:MAG: T9SS type A sorting domain-containing protein [Lutimonas sp.]
MKKHYIVFLFFLLFGFSAVCSAQTDLESSEPAQEEMTSFKLNEAVKMFPNPVQHYVNLQSSIPITRVQVFSLLGQLLKDVPKNPSRIYLGDLDSGIYMIKIYSNEHHITKKLVKR